MDGILCAYKGDDRIFMTGNSINDFSYFLNDENNEISLMDARRKLLTEYRWIEMPQQSAWIGLISHQFLTVEITQVPKKMPKSTALMVQLAESLFANLNRVGGSQNVSESAFKSLERMLIHKIKKEHKWYLKKGKKNVIS